ncbi:MAG: hypothetical protein JSS81_10035 [Acidobacteria bacterium]|nr:hypothetical protein [Acidobacteriota bacterium]
MIVTTLLFDLAPFSGGVGAFLGLAFFFVLAAVAFVAYKMLKRTVKMAVRMTIVVVILLIALIGSLALFMMGGSGARRPPITPTPQKTR